MFLINSFLLLCGLQYFLAISDTVFLNQCMPPKQGMVGEAGDAALPSTHAAESGLFSPLFSSVATNIILAKFESRNRWSSIIPDSVTVGNPLWRCEMGIKVSSAGEGYGVGSPWGMFPQQRRQQQARGHLFCFVLFFFIYFLK